MSEQEIREGMLLAVWDEPPLDFDPDTLIRRVEQKKSRRRALVAVGVATAVIAVASLALPGLLPRDRDSQLGADTPASSSAPPSVSVEKKAQRAGDQLAAKLGVTMTNLTDIAGSFNPGRLTYPPFTTSTPARAPGDPEFSGYLYLTDQIGPTSLRVEAGVKGLSTKDFCGGATMCKDVQQKDGSVVTEAEFNEGTPEIARAEVQRVFQSGYVVRISSHNYNPATSAGLRQTVPVRVGVLTELVTDPAVAWQ
ncbi:hypothetical protein SAMN04488564_104802 [Lentzea waywayandensis]|uniref:Uncharacterized protein n=1 Tax=Lentzea waywayandensis TaxID=84724 RepID=A0A1I6EKY1_9PSEU|nr:hypothetical protein [Lentzea waywayandensis]SFR18390.1 hypothetical protein SAMN04488564_104802 [Lentzea waywayandensis]